MKLGKTKKVEKNEPRKYSLDLAGSKMEIEVGKLAEMASSSVTVCYGETVVLATVVVSDEPKEGAEFFPMMVDYEERWYASGKISGSRFVKRETKPSDEAILSGRMIDRALRPLFPKNYYNDIQIVITVLSVDLEHDPDVISTIAASTALMLSPAPFKGPIGLVKIGKINNKFVTNPKMSEMENSELDLVLSATKESILMINGKAKELPEDEFVKACKIAFEEAQPLIKLQEKIVKDFKINKHDHKSPQEELEAKMKKYLGAKLAPIIAELDLEKRNEGITQFETQVLSNFEGAHKQIDIRNTFEKIIEAHVRELILDKGIRPDGRKPDEIRPLTLEVGLLPRTHGSAIFQRGQTQVLTVTTLGSPGREQVIETMEEEATKRYMHHYTFPPFSVGEISPLRAPSRREIGHGALAEKALEAVVPDKELFPYTVRVVSEVMSSNGSTSMAAVCGSTLSLMDAGVPIKAPVAGISIGMVSDDKKHILLTDIMGIEDFSGDMDFKLAGTRKGLTAFQLDVKTHRLNIEIVKEAVATAQKVRYFLLDEIKKVIEAPRKNLSPFAPAVSIVKISPDKIRNVVGPGGKVINKIIAETGVSIDIEQDGIVNISGQNQEQVQKAKDWVSGLIREAKVGEVFTGQVSRIMDFGAFVEILPNQEGLIHISKLAPHHIKKVSDVVNVGDMVSVKIIEIDSQGRINLSLLPPKQ